MISVIHAAKIQNTLNIALRAKLLRQNLIHGMAHRILIMIVSNSTKRMQNPYKFIGQAQFTQEAHV